MAPRKRTPAADDQIRLSDPKAIKALAHPARMAVLGALSSETGITATEAAEITGLSPSAMSYHLRAMARWGVLVPIDADAGGDGRQRRWKLAGRGFTIEANDPAAAAPTALFAADALDRTREAALRWIGENRGADAPAWQKIMAVSHSETWLTESEAQAVADDVMAVFDRHKARRSKPDGARRVRIGFVLVPVD